MITDLEHLMKASSLEDSHCAMCLLKGLGAEQNEAIISMAPINSTGDIYHLMSYLILAPKCCSPRIVFTYDTDETKEKATLCLNFGKSLICEMNGIVAEIKKRVERPIAKMLVKVSLSVT